MPLRKSAETIMALYVAGFGAFVAAYEVGGVNAMAWTGMNIVASSWFAWLCIWGATIHALGLWLNGSYRWSPIIRASGLLMGSGLFAHLAWLGAGAQNTAGFTYLAVFVGFFFAFRTAVRDCVLAWRGRYGSAH